MTKDGLTIRLIGSKLGLLRLKRAGSNLKSRKKLFERIIIYLEGSHGKTFKIGGRPKWQVSQRAAMEGGQTLRDTNQLFMSVTGRGKDAVRKATDKNLIFGTSLIHGAVHQFGNPDRGLPARPWLGIHREDERAIEKISKDWGIKIVVGGK